MKKLFNSLLIVLSILLMTDQFIDAARYHKDYNRDKLTAQILRQNPYLLYFLNQFYQIPSNARGQLIIRLVKHQNKNNKHKNNHGKQKKNNKKHKNKRRIKPAQRPRPIVPVQRPIPVSPIPAIPRPIAQFVINRANKNWYGLDNKLPLPGSVRSLPFEYIYSKQQNGWSCGYNCLFNACNVESYFGRNNSNSDLTKFSNVCMRYLNQIGANPAGAGDSRVLEKLAGDLKLQKYIYLENGSGYIAPLIHQWTYGGNVTSSQAKKAAQNRKIQDVKNHLNQNKGSMTFVHFVCHVNDYGPHAVLVSLVQKPNGSKSFYIFDNLNAQITEYSDIMPYLRYIYNNFK